MFKNNEIFNRLDKIEKQLENIQNELYDYNQLKYDWDTGRSLPAIKITGLTTNFNKLKSIVNELIDHVYSEKGEE